MWWRVEKSILGGSGVAGSVRESGDLDRVVVAPLDHRRLRDEAAMPPDAPRLAPAVECVIAATRQTSTAVTAELGFGEAAIDELGVTTVAILRKGKPGINMAGDGLNYALEGARTWCGWRVKSCTRRQPQSANRYWRNGSRLTDTWVGSVTIRGSTPPRSYASERS